MKIEKNENQKFLYRAMYLSMIFSLSYLCGMPIGVNLNIPLQILFVFVIAMIVNIFLEHPIYFYIIIAILFLAFVIASFLFKTFLLLFLNRAYMLLENIFYHIKELDSILPENRLIFWGMLIALISIFTWIIIYKVKRIGVLLPIYVGGLLYYWYKYYDAAYYMMALFFLSFFILLGLNRYFREKDDSQNKFMKKFEYSHKSRVNIIISYSIIIVALALASPKTDKYIRWTWVKEKVSEIFPSIETLRSSVNSRTDSIRTGLPDFSRKNYANFPSRLGGPIILDDMTVMVVYSDNPVYLRGNIRHTYTGSHWITEVKNWKSYEQLDEISGITESEKKYYEDINLSIINRSFSTDIIFSPQNPSKVILSNIYGFKVSQDDILSSSKTIESGDRYTIYALEPLDYDELVSLGINRKKEDIENLSLYLQLPEDKITEATRNLVKDIVKDAETDYKKAMAIESYLRENYKYTLDVEIVPEHKDFVDYFLFESKEGYCTYFATAMAIMLRLEGIPVRYVEGFLAHEIRQKGVYVARNNNAHAWVEAFIEPVGWMTFEPTPAYPLATNPEEFPYYEYIQEEELYEGFKGERNLIEDTAITENNIEEGSVGIGKKLIARIRAKYIPLIIIDILLLGIIIRFLAKFTKVKYKDAKINKLPNKEKLIYLYNEVLKLIELRGITREAGETHYEFSNRIAHNFASADDENDIEKITDIFVKNKYSSISTSDEDVAILQDYKGTMEKRIRNFLGFRTYLYRRYFK